MTELTPAQLANAKNSYKKLMANAKAVQKKLQQSWLWDNLLRSVTYILDNYTLQDHIDKWVYDYCNEHNISHLSGNDRIYRPFKIRSFRDYQLQKVKAALDNWEDYSNYAYGAYDYSIHANGIQKKGWYSAEYKGCGNWHYYILLDYDTALFYEDD